MVKATLATLLSAASLSAAFPYIPQMDAAMGERLAAIQKRAPVEKRADVPARQPVFVDTRENTGVPSTTFDAQAQHIDVSDGSAHEFRSPGSGDLRGQCPGLNAAANHGFLPRSGVTSIQQTIDGLGTLYGLAADSAIFLSVVAIGLGGDPLTNSWSIGGAFPTASGLPTGGIVATHNKYEGDASVSRGDAYLNGGKVGVFQNRAWEHLYALGDNGFGFAQIQNQADYNTRWSVANNPYYFSAPFSGLVAPAAHNFVIHFMSNHTAEKPGGVLTQETLSSFWAVTGEPGNFVQHRGQERIPDNWYRRPLDNPHPLSLIIPDVLITNAAYPGTVKFGGNTGTVNSFVGVDTGDYTNGAMNLADLANGNNGACFLLQASLAGMPAAANPLLGSLGSVLNYVTQQFAPLQSKLSCPQLNTFNNNLFNQFPGASYQTSG